ncbi:unknown similar to AMEV109 [Choristoneura biennis entomopoxvirus]|uniref:Type VII secretion system protein EssD-like domain-containing protein n=1 Tax=Choristoneura biennis entomopoxvirus TaxID=10288 RepID=A0A916KPK2_CBEPV|nr:unknown similar to AMEV109 [Choristoneura biennis entomopoxvirus]CCU55699.1 unknown similar to AMEV109 [Choristoneura biennis entomopoxvirus]
MYNIFIFILFYNIIFINCYSYLSTIEANLLYNDKLLCMGDCRDVYGQKKCIYDWHAHELECKSLYIQTKKYKTIDNIVCTSNCGNFDEEPYEWCATKIGDIISWGKCNRKIATKGVQTYRTYNKYITCTDICKNRNDNYGYWCHTLNNNWDYCYPDKKVILFNFIRNDNKICATPCELYTDNKAYCYDKDENWDKCFLNPEYKNNLNVYNMNIKHKCRPGNYISNGYRYCRNFIQKRDLFFNACSLDVEQIGIMKIINPTVIVRNIDPDIISLDDNPIHSYTVLPTYSYFGNDQLNLPLTIRAIITMHTLRNPGERESFPAEIDHHFNNMNPNLNHVNYDERGHIIGSRLGGPTETYNIIPQSWVHNRGRMSRWQYLESDLNNFMRNNPNRYAEFTAIVSYGTDPINGHLNYRPTGIGQEIRLYDNGSMVNLRGEPVLNINNSLENMYFTNDPDYSCIIEGDEVEDNFK